MPEPLLRMEGIGMSFGSTRALDGVAFDLVAGEVHALAGAHPLQEGRMLLGGRPLRVRSPRDAAQAGMAVIYQELSLVPSMSVEDNLFLGLNVPRREGRARCRSLLDELALDIDPAGPVEALSLASQQMVEIAKALAREARVVVMDEPTSALHETEAERLFEMIAKLKARGCGIVYVSHRMEELYRLADRITVLRDGRHIATEAAADLPRDKLVSLMVGRSWSGQVPPRSASPGEVRLLVKGLTVPGRGPRAKPRVNDLMFSVRSGEVLGLAGLQGAGCSDALHAIFGALGPRVRCEKMELGGERIRFRDPDDAIACGVALLTNDRKANGIIAGMSVAANITLAALPRFARHGWLHTGRERQAAKRRAEELGVRFRSMGQDIATLSGGNQQKALLARWLESGPRVLLLDEPTRGVDVGAKHDIYQLINRWTQAGLAIVLITSETEELLALADRIIVLHRGRAVAEFERGEATREKITAAAMGDTDADET
jgi:ribose transport system ATP-binding protein